MPGHSNTVKNQELFNNYRCPHCKLLLKDTVQSTCGHLLCESCAQELFASHSPKCPQPDCQKNLKTDENKGEEYFPDRCVRREVNEIVVSCSFQEKGCSWEDKLAKLTDHLKSCSFATIKCQDCGKVQPLSEIETHKKDCPKALVKCPLADHGCSLTQAIPSEAMANHMTIEMGTHVQIMMILIVQLMKEAKQQNSHSEGEPPNSRLQLPGSRQVTDTSNPKTRFFVGSDRGPDTANLVRVDLERGMQEALLTTQAQVRRLQNRVANLSEELKIANTQIQRLYMTSYDGTFLWKIPEIKKRRTGTLMGKYTSLISVPFFSSRSGYKMCLQVYLNGDGIGKNTHMSLFFVVMKGEFDNILPWPFTHKVTFKLINQTGGRDIIDIFQPDPMSSSFRKPKSDMNIASGCPKFVTLSKLENEGFIKDDCVFVRCIVDIS